MGNPSANFEVPEINLISMEFDKIPTWKSPTIIYLSIWVAGGGDQEIDHIAHPVARQGLTSVN